MAYLNVSEHRIEAKIAYVGHAWPAVEATFASLRDGGARCTAVDDALSVSWTPPESARFRDCSVSVDLVAPHPDASAARLSELLHDVDGVVVAVGRGAAARAPSKRSLESVRAAIAESARPDLRIVLHVDLSADAGEGDGDEVRVDAASADAIAAALDALDLPRRASATPIETLELALDGALAALEAGPAVGHAAGREAAVDHPAGREAAVDHPAGREAAVDHPAGREAAVDHPAGREAAVDAATPLLAALKRVLREAVRERDAELDARIAAAVRERDAELDARIAAAVRERDAELDAAMSARLASLEEAVAGRDAAGAEAVVTALGRVERALARADHRVDAFADANARLAERSFALEGVVTASATEIKAKLGGLEARAGELEARVDALHDLAEASAQPGIGAELAELLQEANARLQGLVLAVATSATKQEVASVAGRVTAVREEIAKETARAIDAGDRRAREASAAMIDALDGALASLELEARSSEIRAKVDEVGRAVGDVAQRAGRISSAVDASLETARGVKPRIESLEAAVGLATGALDAALRDVRGELARGIADASRRTADVDARITELVEELKKPKRGWFG